MMETEPALYLTKNAFQSTVYHLHNTFLSFKVDMAFTLNEIDLQMALTFEKTFEQALLEQNHVIELCEL